MIYVWNYFISLHNTRGSSGMGGVNPITYSEMLAYFTLNGIEPMEWEVQVIKNLDNIAIQHFAEQEQKTQSKHNKPTK